MVVVVLLLLVDDLKLKEKLLLVEDFSVRGVQLRRRLPVVLLVRWDILVIFEFLHFGLVIFGFLGSMRCPICAGLGLLLMVKAKQRNIKRKMSDEITFLLI